MTVPAHTFVAGPNWSPAMTAPKRTLLPRKRRPWHQPVTASFTAGLALLAGACTAATSDTGTPTPVSATTAATSTTVTTSDLTGDDSPSSPLSSSTNATTSTTAPTTAVSVPALPVTATVEIILSDYAIAPAHSSVFADEVTISVVNRDGVPHDVVLIATELGPDRLPTSGIRVDINDPAVTVVARTARLPANGIGSLDAVVAPGSYVLVCTVPHHYVRDQMVGTLTVRSPTALEP